MEPGEQTQHSDDTSYQLRVRISAQQRDALEELRKGKFKGESLSDIVRMALSYLIESRNKPPNTTLEKKVAALATILKREPRQVEQACIEGIFDLIESKAAVPLIVMESQLHLSYGTPEGVRQLRWPMDCDQQHN